METLGQEIIAAGRNRVGKPFRHHYKPYNLCNRGAYTLAQCMERGMDDQGYDCSGLAIASICDVIGVSAKNWPAHFRHIAQLERVADPEIPPNPGDFILFISESDLPRLHMGILVVGEVIIHASSRKGEVIEEEFSEFDRGIEVVSAATAHELARLNS